MCSSDLVDVLTLSEVRLRRLVRKDILNVGLLELSIMKDILPERLELKNLLMDGFSEKRVPEILFVYQDLVLSETNK